MLNDLGARIHGNGWSEEYDCIPLRLRRKMLHSIDHVKEEDTYVCIAGDVNGKQLIETENHPSTALCTKALELTTHQASDSGLTSVSLDNSSSGDTVDCFGDSDLNRNFKSSSICLNKMPTSEARVDVEQLIDLVGAFLHQTSTDVPRNVFEDCVMGSSSANEQASEVKHEMFYEFDDALDNVILKERRKMLVSRKLMQSSRLDMKELNGGSSNLSNVVLQSAESNSIQDTLVYRNINLEVKGCDNPVLENATDETSHTANKCSPLPVSAALSFNSRSSPLSVESKSFDTQETAKIDACGLASSVLPSLAKVKDEPLDISELCSEGKNIRQNSFIGQITVKNEPGLSEFPLDELDHMPLVDRAKLLLSGLPSFEVSGKPDHIKEDVASALGFGNEVLGSVKPVSMSRPRKKRRTATDSVETALEEDAPGLLKVLLDRGVSADEIKLYGEEGSDDALDSSLSEDGFAELEAVISQLFSQRQTFLKFPLLRTKGEKVSYCLSCLLSLVEQTRYLRNRKWPVEWGWCRDLQSFIFVFQRHNRIVLERPEYGYATYFFELLNSVPVAWQVKRLVTAMKLTKCGRITLIENRPLLVGQDLSEGEARVLAEYGWTPNTGLGTMLNYCDRVVHDRKQELDSSEWRLKIGRQLMNGYNGGTIVANNLPKKLTEYQDLQNVQVKLEE